MRQTKVEALGQVLAECFLLPFRRGFLVTPEAGKVYKIHEIKKLCLFLILTFAAP